MAQGQGAKAVSLLKDFVEANPDQAGPFAVLLEELGQFPDAQELYRRYVSESKKPEAVLVLAEFLGRRGRTSEAVSLCDEAWKSCNPEAVANTSVSAILAAQNDAEQARNVERRLVEATKAQPENVAIQFAWPTF